jgi:hypothetical protein
MTPRGAIVAMALAFATVVGCGVQADDQSRVIPETDRRDLSAPAALDDGELSGDTRIFLLATPQTGVRTQLRAVTRDVAPTPSSALTALLAGPTGTEQTLQLRSAIPEGTELRSASFVAPGTVTVDVSSELFDATGDELIDAMAQIVFTASALERVERVQILVGGEPKQLPRGDGQLVAGPLTVFDFPERVASSQPHYPALPSPVVNQPKNTSATSS